MKSAALLVVAAVALAPAGPAAATEGGPSGGEATFAYAPPSVSGPASPALAERAVDGERSEPRRLVPRRLDGGSGEGELAAASSSDGGRTSGRGRALVAVEGAGGPTEQSVVGALERAAGRPLPGAVMTIEGLSTLSVDLDVLEAAGVSPEELARALESVGTVAQEDPVVWALAPNDPIWPQQWGLRTVGLPFAWDRTLGSSDLVVAVVDTGVSPVSELSGRLLPGWNFVDGTSDTTDDHGHGTMAATVIAAAFDDGAGMAGVCGECRILPVRVLDSAGSGTHSTVAAGIVYAADQGAQVINLSLGGPSSSQLIDDAVAYARAAGALVVASAGNDGVDSLTYPAASPGALSVAGSNEADDGLYSWSNFGAWVDVAAPGCNVAQSFDQGFYFFCGTSSSAPLVSGVAALAISYVDGVSEETLSDQELYDLFRSSAAPMPLVGAGRVDAEELFTALERDYATSQSPADVIAPQVVFLSPGPSRHLRGVVQVSASASDDVGVGALELWHGADRVAVADPSVQSVSLDTGTLPDGPVTLRWRAYDAAGNVGVVERAFFVDNSPPLLSFSSPAHATRVAGWTSLAPQVSDSVALSRVDVYSGTERLGSAWSAPWSVTVDTSLLPDGETSFRFRAHDRAGNVSVVSRTLFVDNTPPQAAVAWPNPGRFVSGVVPVTLSVSDGGGVAETVLRANGQEVARFAYLPEVISWDTTLAPDGRVELEAQVSDRAGNVSFSPARVVEVKNARPEVSFLSPSPAQGVAEEVEVRLSFASLGPGGLRRLEVWAGGVMLATVDGRPDQDAVMVPLAGVPEGPVWLRVVVVDSLGIRSLPVSRQVLRGP